MEHDLRTGEKKAHPQSERLQKGLALAMDLRRELTRWSHDHGNRALERLDGTLILDVAEHREEEGDRLAGSRLGYADDVAPGHDGRDRLGLDRRGSRVLEASDDFDAVEKG